MNIVLAYLAVARIGLLPIGQEKRVMGFYWFLLTTLGVWRITHLLVSEDGPWDIFVCIHRKIGIGFWGRLLGCFYCVSLWIAAPFAFIFGEEWKERLLLWPALSAGAILLERLTQREKGPPSAFYFEEKENDNVVLRKEQGTDLRSKSVSES